MPTPRGADAAFERPPLGPEGEAMGGLLAVSTDVVFGNPAGAAGAAAADTTQAAAGAASVSASPRLRLRAATARPFGLDGVLESQASLARAGRTAGIGVGLRRFGTREYSERELRLTAAWAASPSLSLGAAARGLQAGGAFAAVRSFALDVGFRVRSDGVEVGALVEAVLGEVPGDPRGELRRTAFGIRRALGPAASVAVELQRQGQGPLAAAAGIDWEPVPFLTLRAGAREEPRTLSGGFTARRGAVAVSGSASWASPLGRTVRIGLGAFPGGGTPAVRKGDERLKNGRPGTE